MELPEDVRLTMVRLISGEVADDAELHRACAYLADELTAWVGSPAGYVPRAYLAALLARLKPDGTDADLAGAAVEVWAAFVAVEAPPAWFAVADFGRMTDGERRACLDFCARAIREAGPGVVAVAEGLRPEDLDEVQARYNSARGNPGAVMAIPADWEIEFRDTRVNAAAAVIDAEVQRLRREAAEHRAEAARLRAEAGRAVKQEIADRHFGVTDRAPDRSPVSEFFRRMFGD